MGRRDDDFPKRVRDKVAARAGHHCSICGKPTSGPSTNPADALNLGVAAHITAASPGGPRYDASLTPDQRKSIHNAIWACQKHGKLIDNDPTKYTESELREKKAGAENRASIAAGAGSAYRAIADVEHDEGLTLGERAILRGLKTEFGCKIKTSVRIRAGTGWLNADAAVVRDEDIVVIQIYELHPNGFPYFQVEFLLELLPTVKFDRFKKSILCVAVVSDQPKEMDEEVRTHLEAMKAEKGEMRLLFYRLHALLAKYGM